MKVRVVHPYRILVFTLLSLADFSLTWWLLQGTAGQVYESNPVANWWLASFGWVGLLGFKLGVVAVVAGLTLVIACSRPRASGRILTFGCSVLGIVVLYSCAVGGWLNARPNGLADEDPVTVERTSLAMDQERERSWNYSVVLAELSEGVASGTYALTDAAARLADCPKAQDPAWLALLREVYPERSDAECLAANIVEHAFAARKQSPPAELQEVKNRLSAEYLASYGTPCPAIFRPPAPPSFSRTKPRYTTTQPPVLPREPRRHRFTRFRYRDLAAVPVLTPAPAATA